MNEPIVSVRQLAKSFGPNRVLNGIDIDVQPSQVIVVIGPSGSGKSTFLRCLNGLETAEEGTVRICGHALVDNGRMIDENGLNRIRRDVGMVFQSFNLFPHLTVLQNVTLAPVQVLRRSREEAERGGS
jgi:polar amino acid transport system ATP-binding protein